LIVCDDVLGLRNGWQIISPSKSFTVYAATASEKTEWMAHIEKCAQDLLTKRKNHTYLSSKYVRTIKVSKATKRHCAGTVQSHGGRVGNVKQVGFEPRPEDSYGRCGSDKIRQ